jgi:uncharacterized protein DUF2786
VTELAARIERETISGDGGADWSRQRVVRLLAGSYAAPAPVERAADSALCGVLECPWQRGWQPVDVWQIVRRRMGSTAARFVVGAIAANAAQYAEATLHPRWRAQLDELEARIWWNQSRPYVQEWSRHNGQDVPAVLALVYQLLWMLRRLPPEPELIARPGTATTSVAASPATPAVDSKVLAKVRALLAKAESTEFTEEAEAFFAKAQELMSRYSLERAALNVADHDDPGRGTGGRRIWLDNPYLRPRSILVHAVAEANRCRAVYTDLGFLTVVGEATDTEIVEVLSTSLLVQASRAMRAAGSQVNWRGQSRTKSFRYAFLTSYAQRISERLREAAAQAQAAVTESLGDGRLLPVLAARERAVAQRFRELFPQVGTARAMSVSNAAGWSAGRAAADLAVLDVHRAVRGGLAR